MPFPFFLTHKTHHKVHLLIYLYQPLADATTKCTVKVGKLSKVQNHKSNLLYQEILPAGNHVGLQNFPLYHKVYTSCNHRVIENHKVGSNGLSAPFALKCSSVTPFYNATFPLFTFVATRQSLSLLSLIGPYEEKFLSGPNDLLACSWGAT